jgi:hypothetical protein
MMLLSYQKSPGLFVEMVAKNCQIDTGDAGVSAAIYAVGAGFKPAPAFPIFPTYPEIFAWG